MRYLSTLNVKLDIVYWVPYSMLVPCINHLIYSLHLLFFYRWIYWGLKRWDILFNDAQLVRGRTRIRIQLCPAPESVPFTMILTLQRVLNNSIKKRPWWLNNLWWKLGPHNTGPGYHGSYHTPCRVQWVSTQTHRNKYKEASFNLLGEHRLIKLELLTSDAYFKTS